MSLISDLLDAEHRKLLRPSGGCAICPRRKKDFVPATLIQSQILFLGEAPGETEVKEQEGFTGASGTFLREHAADAGITSFSLNNTIHCRPPGNRNPSAEEMDCCLSQFVLDEIRGYEIVVMVGNVPFQALFPGAKPARFRGNVAHHPDFPGQKFYMIYHPAYILRRRDQEEVFRRQMERLARIAKGEPAPAYQIFSGGGKKYWQVLEKILSSSLISLDLETNSLQSWPISSRIRSLALAADEEQVVFAHENEAHWISVLAHLRKYLEKPEKHVVCANAGFDLDFLEEELGFRIKTTGIHDVFPLFYEAAQYKMPSLKELVSRELDGYRYLVYDPSTETNLDLLGRYNAEDVIYPLQLFRQGMAKVQPKTRDLLMRVSSPSGYILRHISKNGFYVRRGYLQEKIKEYNEREQETLAAWREEDPRFVPTFHDSGKGLHQYLFKILGVSGERKTDKGNFSTDDSALKAWVRQGFSPLRHLLALRKIEKFQSTYLWGMEKHIGPDSRVHSQFTTTFTDSARSSSRGPNIQNIPRDKEIRDLFGAPPGFVLLESDLSQIELRIMFCLAGDPVGIAAYNQGLDAHILTARSFCAGSEPTKEERTWAKVINFALCVPMDTEILTREGWKKYDQVKVGDETPAFEGERMVWSRIKRKFHYEDQPLVRTFNGTWEATTTPEHRWFGDKRVDRGMKGKRLEQMFFQTNEITREHRIWLSRPLQADTTLPITPAEAGVIGWLYTDGSVRWHPESNRTSAGLDGRRRSVSGKIFQTERKFASEIRTLLSQAGLDYSECAQKNQSDLVIFLLRSPEVRELLRRADLEYGDLESFVRRLGTNELEAFTLAARQAEGYAANDYKYIGQNDGPTRRALELALFLSGFFVRSVEAGKYKTNTQIVLKAGAPRVTGQRLQQEDVGRSEVWCVETEHGTWTMRQNDRIMVTGNCYGGDDYKVQQWARDQYGLDWSRSQAKEFVAYFFGTYTKLGPYHRQCDQELTFNRGWFESVTGHIFHYKDWDHPDRGKRDHAYRAHLNARAQGPAAQIMFLIMIHANRLFVEEGFPVRMVNTVHDSVIMEVPEGEEGRAISILEEAKTIAYSWVRKWFVVPLILEHEVGRSWGALEEWSP